MQSALKADDTGNFFSANGSEENPLYQEEIKLTEEQKTNFIALLEKQITSLTKNLEQMQNPETVLRITEIIKDWKQEINILHE